MRKFLLIVCAMLSTVLYAQRIESDVISGGRRIVTTSQKYLSFGRYGDNKMSVTMMAAPNDTTYILHLYCNEKTEDVKLDHGVTLIFDDGSTMALNAMDDSNVTRKIETVVVNYNPFVIPVFTNPLPLMSSGHFLLSKADFRTLVEKPVVKIHIETQVKPVERKTKKFQKNMIKFSKLLK